MRAGDRGGDNHPVSVLDLPRPLRTAAVVATVLVVAACGSSAQPAPTPSPSAAPSTSSGQRFDVTAYGAQGDGQTDNTQAFAQAISAAEAAGGGTVYVPAGQYLFSAAKTANPASVSIQGSAPITLMGAGRDTTSLIEARAGKGLLGVHIDGSIVESLTLDTKTNGGGSAIFVQANHTNLLHTRVLGGPKHFAIYYAGPKGAKPLTPLYNVGNTVSDLDLNELDCDDGFSWSFQQGGTISDVTHTGSRLALYVDQTTMVTNYRYTPGSQQCGARNGFWITPPADHLTITGFSSSGEGGKIGVIAAKGAGKLASNITITGETMTAAGYTLTIGDVSNLSLNNCNLGTDNIVIAAVATATGTVSRCKYGQLVRGGSPTAKVAISVAPS
jgi:Pectate lyase superfamily protein